MPSYCSISEAWGNEFKKDTPNSDQSLSNNIEQFQTIPIVDNLVEPSNNNLNEHMEYKSINKSNNIAKSDYTDTDTDTDSSTKIEYFDNKKLILDKCNCTLLLKEVLKCKECQKIIYDNIKDQFQSTSYSINNSDILNSILIGFFIILILDLFVKIGKLFSRSN